jgi:hypothetical protein
MKKLMILLLATVLLLGAVATSSYSFKVSPAVVHAQDSGAIPIGGPCSLLSTENPRSDDCDREIAANPFIGLEAAVEYDEERDDQAHPRSVLLPEEMLPYPIAWQKRPWYFSDAPGVLPADDDWTTARLIGKYSMYYIYDAVEVDNAVWYLIESGQWMKDEFVSVLQIPERPEGVEGPWVALDLQQQTLVALVDDTPVYATLISAGYWLDTLEGLFQVYARTLSMIMQGPPGANPPEYRFYTQWVMFFNEHEALHSADFHNYFGINRTHGCVNLAPGDAEWVWHFFEQTVDDWDPTGTSSFFVDNPEAAPWVYIYQSDPIVQVPQW